MKTHEQKAIARRLNELREAARPIVWTRAADGAWSLVYEDGDQLGQAPHDEEIVDEVIRIIGEAESDARSADLVEAAEQRRAAKIDFGLPFPSGVRRGIPATLGLSYRACEIAAQTIDAHLSRRNKAAADAYGRYRHAVIQGVALPPAQ